MTNSLQRRRFAWVCGGLLGLASAGCSSDATPDTGPDGAGSAGAHTGGAGFGGAGFGGAGFGGAGFGGAGFGGAGLAGGGFAGGAAPSGGAPSGGAPSDTAGSSQGGSSVTPEGGSGGASAGSAGAASLPNLTLYLAGDSTVSEYTLDPNDPKSWAGWGQMLAPSYTGQVKVVDAAVGGRTARRFIQEGSLAAILKTIHAGDYLFVQFGTNDSNTTATYTLNGTTYDYFADAQTDFKTYLQQYIDGAQGKQAIPVLVTPPPRNSAYCKGPRSLANYGQAMLELGKADGVGVLDLGLKTHAYLSAVCPKPTTANDEQFFKINADKTIDGTHFQENGARIMAGFVADGVDELKLGLSSYRKR